MFYSAILGFGAYLWTRIVTRRWQRFALITALLASLLPNSARRLSEVELDLMGSLLLLGFGCWTLVTFFRNNYLAYALAPAMLALFRAATAMRGHGNFTLEIQSWLLLAIALGMVAILMIGQRAKGAATG